MLLILTGNILGYFMQVMCNQEIDAKSTAWCNVNRTVKMSLFKMNIRQYAFELHFALYLQIVYRKQASM